MFRVRKQIEVNSDKFRFGTKAQTDIAFFDRDLISQHTPVGSFSCTPRAPFAACPRMRVHWQRVNESFSHTQACRSTVVAAPGPSRAHGSRTSVLRGPTLVSSSIQW